jgi:hypothetical protein
MGGGGVSYIRRGQAEQLILETCEQFSGVLEQLDKISRGYPGREAEQIGRIYGEYSLAAGGSPGDAEIGKKLETGLGQELRESGREYLEEMLRECRELARGYELPVRGELPEGEIYITHECPVIDFSDFYYEFSANALRCDIPLMQNDSYYRLGESLKENFTRMDFGGGDSFSRRRNQRSQEIIVFRLRHGYGSSTLELGPGIKAGTALLNMPLPKRFVLPEGATDSMGREFLYFDNIHLQCLFGYNRLYENFTSNERFCDIDSVRTYFYSAKGERIAIWLWKGDYYMTFNEGWHIGAEIGAYWNYFSSDKIIESASFILSNQDGELLRRTVRNQYWINGFVRGKNDIAANLIMRASITFYDIYDAEKYEEAIRLGIDQEINRYYASNVGINGRGGNRDYVDVKLYEIERSGRTVNVTFQ